MEAYCHSFFRTITIITALHASLNNGDLSILTITEPVRSDTTVIKPPPWTENIVLLCPWIPISMHKNDK